MGKCALSTSLWEQWEWELLPYGLQYKMVVCLNTC